MGRSGWRGGAESDRHIWAVRFRMPETGHSMTGPVWSCFIDGVRAPAPPGHDDGEGMEAAGFRCYIRA